MTAVVVPLPNIWGASAEDWTHFDMILGLLDDLLPVVSNPHAKIAEGSTLKALGKVPSVYDRGGKVVGLRNWTSRCTTANEMTGWAAQRDYGICVQTRRCRAIDIDIDDPVKAARIAAYVDKALGVALPRRVRDGTAKLLMPVLVAGEMGKTVIHTDGGAVEVLGNGQQFIAVGTHPKGAKYRWEGGLPGSIPEVSPDAFRELLAGLAEAYAIAPVVEGKAPGEREADIAGVDDPVADWLESQGLVEGSTPRGLKVRCPWADEHSNGSEEAMWLPAGGRGKAEGHFKCLHSHCEGRTRSDYLAAVGYVEDIASQFDVIPDEADAPIEELVAAETAKQRPKIQVANFLDLFADDGPEEPDYIAPDFLGPSGFCLIAGPPKAQKSFLLQEMLMACAMGSTFLAGAFTVPKPLKVFWVQAEMSRKLLRKRVQMFGGSLTDEQRALLAANFAVTERFAMLLDKNGVEATAAAIKAVFPDGPDIIAFDPLANLYDGESEDKAADIMRFLTQRIEAVRRKVNPRAGVVLVHHATKKNAEDMNRDPFVAIRGSGALRGYYETGVVIFRKADDAPERRVFFELRAGESPEPLTVRLGPFGFFEKVEGEQNTPRKKVRQLSENEAQVMEAVAELSLAGDGRIHRAALTERACDIIMTKRPDVKPFRAREAVGRAIKSLLRVRVLGEEGHFLFEAIK